MATAERQARVVWDSPLRAGNGQLELVSSGIGTYPVTRASQVEQGMAGPAPRELLAATHASCYTMARNATLSAVGTNRRDLQEAADEAEQPCPFSNWLRNNVQITVTATLES